MTQEVSMKGLEDLDGLSEAGEPPQGPERMEQEDRVLVLPVNGDSRKITQILSNGTSLKILELLGNKSMSATNIAEELNLPLTTVKYNLDSLVESDLIKVKQIKWSQKGRQVKIYESMEKLIVLVPSRNSMDKPSIISILQKYIGVIGAAFFAAAGVEYFSAYMQAKRVIDATAPLRMGVINTTSDPLSKAMIVGTNESDNMSSTLALDQQMPENGAMNVSSEVLDVGSGNASSGLESGPANGAAEVYVPASNVSDSAQSMPTVPHEGLAHAGGIHGLYDFLSLHPGVWFLFGCIFIVFLMIVREVYYKKKSK
ncbi:MAG: helix-turn-helix domain-containing protein [Methanosarcina sp.]